MLSELLRGYLEKMDDFYSVDEFTEKIAQILENDPHLTGVWVLGEVSSLRVRKNHLFFNLLGESSRLPCVFFGMGWLKLAEGELIGVYGEVKVYRQGGYYSFHVENIERTGAYGIKSLRFFQIYSKLMKEGAFSRPRRTLPEFPYRIGLIVSKDSAALMDILKVFKEKGYYFEIKIFHTSVQGKDAANELVEALKSAAATDLDAIIVARGGGSKDDLWTFNDEKVVRAALSVPKYLITGIGHEVDTVMLDMVADERAHTPTAAAEVITSRQREFMDNLRESTRRIFSDILDLMEYYGNSLETRLRYTEASLEDIFKRYKTSLKLLGNSLKGYVNLTEEKLVGSFRRIRDLSPEEVVKRGFAIVIKNGRIVRSIKEISSGDILKIVLKDGDIEVKVK